MKWIIELIIVAFYFSLVIALGAGASLDRAHHKINKFYGDISYPLYMTHYPFMWIFANYVVVTEPSIAELSWVIPISVILLIFLSYLVFRFLDFPIRRYFTEQLKVKKSLTS